MGHGHAHRDGPARVPAARGALTVLLGFLAVAAVATVVGVVALWPDSAKVDALRDSAQFAAPGVTFVEATVTAVSTECPVTPGAPEAPEAPGASGDGPSCGTVEAELDEGPEKGETQSVGIPTAVAESGLAAGDTVRLVRVPGDAGAQASYSFDDVVRLKPLWLLWVAFVVVVAAVARLRGVLALVSLGFAALVLLKFMLPALLSGSSGIAVSMVGSSAIMFVVLYLAHGPSARTSAASGEPCSGSR